MKQNKIAALFAAAFFLALLSLSCKTQGNAKAEKQILQGMVKIYGNEPHTWTGIETVPGGNIYSVNPREKAAELAAMQGRLLEFTVKIEDAQMPGTAGTATVISWRIIR